MQRPPAQVFTAHFLGEVQSEFFVQKPLPDPSPQKPRPLASLKQRQLALPWQ